MSRRFRPDGLMSRRAARSVTRPYAHAMAGAVLSGWADWQTLGASPEGARVRAKIKSGARAHSISDCVRYAIQHRFQQMPGVRLASSNQLQYLELAGGELAITAGKIDLARPLPKPRTERAARMYYQSDAGSNGSLLAVPTTWAKVGYVLNATETDVALVVLACWRFGHPVWQLELPRPRALGGRSHAGAISVERIPETVLGFSSSAHGQRELDGG